MKKYPYTFNEIKETLSLCIPYQVMQVEDCKRISVKSLAVQINIVAINSVYPQ